MKLNFKLHYTKRFMNKFNFFISAFAITLCVALSSCKSDDEKKAPDNKFTLGLTSEKIIDGGFIMDESVAEDDDGNTYHRNAVVFVTEGGELTNNPISGGVAFTKKGSYVELYLNNKGQTLETGTYPFQTEENEQPFDFWFGILVLKNNTEEEQAYRFISGNVVVSKSGSTYTIKVEGEVQAALVDEEDGGWAGADPEAPEQEMTIQYTGKLDTYSWDF